MTIFVVPLESYDSRYTEQWNRWFPAEMEARGLEFEYLSTQQHEDVDLGGAVLDALQTNRHRARQVDQLMGLFSEGRVEHGDVVLLHSLWFPGIEALAYMRDLLKIRFRIVGVLHAGSYDPWDFRALAGMDRWSAPLENAWLEIADCVIVASEFHRRMILASRSVDPGKLVVTGLPFSSNEIRAGRADIAKLSRVAFPHRLVAEKNPDVVEFLKGQVGTEQVVVTREVATSKGEYLDVMAASRVAVSDSLQETFGYSMLESSALGCVPIVPDRLSYQEMYPARYRFRSRDELVEKVRLALAGGYGELDDLNALIEWADGSLGRILEVAIT